MKRTALAVLGIALVLISLAACSPSNNGLIIPPPVVNPDKDPGNEPGKDPEPNPPTVETDPVTIAEKLNLPNLIKTLLGPENDAYEVTYETYDTASRGKAKATTPPVAEADSGIKATVKFVADYKVNDVVTINEGGSIVYTISGLQLETGFVANETCTVEAENLQVNGQDVEFTATAKITISATINVDEVTVTSVSVTAVTKIENATIGGTAVTITPDESGTDPGETDPEEPPVTDDDEEESEGTGGEDGNFGSGTSEPVA